MHSVWPPIIVKLWFSMKYSIPRIDSTNVQAYFTQRGTYQNDFLVVIPDLSTIYDGMSKIHRKNTNSTVFMGINAKGLGYYSSCIFPSWRQCKLQLKRTNCNITFQFAFKAHNRTRCDLDAASIGIVFITLYLSFWRHLIRTSLNSIYMSDFLSGQRPVGHATTKCLW